MKNGVNENEKWPELSLKERDRRWSRTKDMLRNKGLDCLVVFGLRGREWYDRYLTNDRSGGTTIFPFSPISSMRSSVIEDEKHHNPLPMIPFSKMKLAETTSSAE